MEHQGVSFWRQIAETLRREIEDGVYPENERLPASADLAARFSVNKHTVLRAISHLQSEGIIRMERGRGAYAIVAPMEFRLGATRWFEENLLGSNSTPTKTIISAVELPADTEKAKVLRIEPGERIAYVTMVGHADDTPINFAYHYIPISRVPGALNAFLEFAGKGKKKLSVTKLLTSLGARDLRRDKIRIRSRRATSVEAQHLRVSTAEHVLCTHVTLIDGDCVPVRYAETCYASSRIDLVIDL